MTRAAALLELLHETYIEVLAKSCFFFCKIKILALLGIRGRLLSSTAYDSPKDNKGCVTVNNIHYLFLKDLQYMLGMML